MAGKAESSLLSRPLYVFDLPEELLCTLELKAELNGTAHITQTSASSDDKSSSEGPDTVESAPVSATSCALCDLKFTNVEEQRSHVRTDLHGYNLKQKMRGLDPVNEQDFERLVGELDESISGSESSSEGSSDDGETESTTGKRKDTTLTALLKKQAHISDNALDEYTPRKRKRGSGRAPMLWFSSSRLPTNTSLGVYRSLFTAAEQGADPATLIRTLQGKQLGPKPPPTKPTIEDSGGVPLPPSLTSNASISAPHYFLCMIGGGHFAGMLISLTPKTTKRSGIEDRAATVIAHKTFHRYTTRRKQGGSQAANDNAKGAAHSAGSSLRRYNEAALTHEIRELLTEWKVWIDSSELLFIRASGTTSRRTLFGPYEEQVIHTNDHRIRGFPFNTRRATQSELMRAFIELTRVKVSTIDAEALAKAQADAEAEQTRHLEDQARTTQTAVESAEREKQRKKQAAIDEEKALHTTQLQALIRRSKAPGLIAYLHSNKLAPEYPFHPSDSPQNHHAPTCLHLAASLNSAACVSALLIKANADPSHRSAEGKTAFEIAGDRATRDAFRVARHELGEQVWDWDGAGVAAALTREEATQRAEREKAESETEKAGEEKRRKEEVERLRKEDAEREDGTREKKFGKARSLVSQQEKSAQEKREEEARGMTAEMRMRLERERRARAAEARFAKK